MRLLKRRMRIGVVGLYQAGKSVFMTSMINHLRQHDPARLPVGDGRVKLDWVADLPPREGIDRFNYERNRNRAQAHARDTVDHGARDQDPQDEQSDRAHHAEEHQPSRDQELRGARRGRDARHPELRRRTRVRADRVGECPLDRVAVD